MTAETLTLIDLAESGAAHELPVSIVDGVIVAPPDAVARTVGWDRKPEGLCRDERCVPVPAGSGLDRDGGLDLAVLADLLRRPLALDADTGAAALGVSAAERGEALSSGLAPDFTLPDLAGRLHSLSDHRGRKVVLYAYASW